MNRLYQLKGTVEPWRSFNAHDCIPKQRAAIVFLAYVTFLHWHVARVWWNRID